MSRGLCQGDGSVDTPYDRNNRLTQTNAVNGNVTTHTKYFYDPNGNQITKMVTVNQPEGQGEAGVQVNFNKTNHYLALLEYNCYNQMVSLDTNGVKTTYAYAPDGLRHSKTVDGIKTSFVYQRVTQGAALLCCCDYSRAIRVPLSPPFFQNSDLVDNRTVSFSLLFIVTERSNFI